jgi:hypothetical protein
MKASAGPLVTRDGKVILNGIRWHTYEHLMDAFASRPSARLAYHKGTLKITIRAFPESSESLRKKLPVQATSQGQSE